MGKSRTRCGLLLIERPRKPLTTRLSSPPLIDDARSRTYDAVCIPLTTAKWMERWRGMCVISSEPDERPEGSELRAETWRANPVFQLGEVTMTRLGMSLLPALDYMC